MNRVSFGGYTAADYTSAPMNRKIQFDFEFGDRSGMNIFMTEEALHESLLKMGKSGKLFTIG